MEIGEDEAKEIHLGETPNVQVQDWNPSSDLGPDPFTQVLNGINEIADEARDESASALKLVNPNDVHNQYKIQNMARPTEKPFQNNNKIEAINKPQNDSPVVVANQDLQEPYEAFIEPMKLRPILEEQHWVERATIKSKYIIYTYISILVR